MSERAYKTLAPLVALTCALFYTLLPSHWFGLRASRWNVLRRSILPALDSHKRDHGGYAKYPLDEAEHVGDLPVSVEAIGEHLADAGYTRMPLSALKLDHTGEYLEAASWSHRESLFAPHQTHVMLFDTDEETRVYAHHEYNAYSPQYAYEHYRGIGMDYEKGKTNARAVLGDLS